MVHELVQVFDGELKLTEPEPLRASDRRFTGSITVTFCFAEPLPDVALAELRSHTCRVRRGRAHRGRGWWSPSDPGPG